MKANPVNFSHIGISVSNLSQAVKFYQDVMNWYLIMKPTLVKEETKTAIGIMCIDVFGKGFKEFKIAHMATGDGIGIELFEFPQTKEKQAKFKPYELGVFHYCVKTPNIEGLVEKIIKHGGKQRMPIREYYPGKRPYKMVYMEDPFGNIVEIYTHSYELHYSIGEYE